MASAQNQSANVVLFDAYFRRADLDRDGRIRGNKAVASFQGSGLSKQVLAQTWAHADQRQTGFLGRAEFILLHEEKQQANQQKARVPELEKHLVNQLSTEEVNSLNSKFKEATEADKKCLRRRHRTNRQMWISSMHISDEPIWTTMAGLVAMKPSLSTRAPVSPNKSLRKRGPTQTRGRLVSLVGQSFTMPLDLSLCHKVREKLRQVKAALYGPAAVKYLHPR